MSTKTVKVEIDIDVFTDAELIDEIKDRDLEGEFYEEQEEPEPVFNGINLKTISLSNKMKLDFFTENIDKISEEDLRRAVR